MKGKSPQLLILGGAGRVGQTLLQQALDRGYHVTALVRDPTVLKAITHPALNVVKGDVRDADLLEQLLSSGVAAVISTLGTFIKKPGTPTTDMTAPLLAAMNRQQVKRLVCMSSLGVGNSKGMGNLTVRIVTGYVLRYVLVDKQCQEKLIEYSGLDWTILRPPRILDKNEHRPYSRWQDFSQALKPKWQISTADAAKEMLDLLEDDSSIGQVWHISH
ncbi:MAG: NAD(P)-binding oxidoreductase [Halioglobus sp.]